VLGVRVAAPIALVITLLVEILVELDGLGALITESQRTFRSARAYGLIGVAGLISLVAGLISLVVHYLVGALETLVLGYRRSA
jgi:ABC-type nitrate/sulfonate/bicarbonate transport system permease component